MERAVDPGCRTTGKEKPTIWTTGFRPGRCGYGAHPRAVAVPVEAHADPLHQMVEH
jgi:hypothetical protein